MPFAIQGETWRTFSPELRVQTAGWMARGRCSYSVITSTASGDACDLDEAVGPPEPEVVEDHVHRVDHRLALDPVPHLG